MLVWSEFKIPNEPNLKKTQNTFSVDKMLTFV